MSGTDRLFIIVFVACYHCFNTISCFITSDECVQGIIETNKFGKKRYIKEDFPYWEKIASELENGLASTNFGLGPTVSRKMLCRGTVTPSMFFLFVEPRFICHVGVLWHWYIRTRTRTIRSTRLKKSSTAGWTPHIRQNRGREKSALKKVSEIWFFRWWLMTRLINNVY